MRRQHGDQGAAAVEFALVLPVLMLIIFGIIDFGRMMNARIVLSQAAYEGARAAAVTGSVADANIAIDRVASGLGGGITARQVDVCGDVPDPAEQASVTLTFQTQYVFPAFGDTMTITVRSVVPCL